MCVMCDLDLDRFIVEKPEFFTGNVYSDFRFELEEALLDKKFSEELAKWVLMCLPEGADYIFGAERDSVSYPILQTITSLVDFELESNVKPFFIKNSFRINDPKEMFKGVDPDELKGKKLVMLVGTLTNGFTTRRYKMMMEDRGAKVIKILAAVDRRSEDNNPVQIDVDIQSFLNTALLGLDQKVKEKS